MSDYRVILRVPAHTLLSALPTAQQAAIEAVGAQFMSGIKFGTVTIDGWKLVDAVTRVPVTPALLAGAGLGEWTIVYQARALDDGDPRHIAILDELDVATFEAHLLPLADGAPAAVGDPSLPAGWPACTETSA